MLQFLSYIHNLRGIAILFVIGVHARGGISDWVSHPDTHYFLATFFDAREGNGTVMFIFIGGFLFQHLTHYHFNFKKYIRQKFKMIILPYLIISIPIILLRITSNYQSLTLPEGFQSTSPVYQFFYHLIVGSHMAPFWFISTIIIFYFSAPALHAIDKPFFYRYIFPFVFIIGLFTFRSDHNSNPFLSYVHFMPIYITGMWASYVKQKLMTYAVPGFWILAIIYFSVPVLDYYNLLDLPSKISFEEVIRERKLVFNIYAFNSITLCFMLTFLFYRLRNVRMPFIELLGHYSFGLFFIHFILITATRKVFSIMGWSVDFSIITFLIYFIFILLASTAMVYLIKRITGRYSRNLIGS